MPPGLFPYSSWVGLEFGGMPWVMDCGGRHPGPLKGEAEGPSPPSSCTNAASFCMPGGGAVHQRMDSVLMGLWSFLEEGRSTLVAVEAQER